MSHKRIGRLRVGTCGFEYAHWRGPFYPRALPRRRWFEHYATLFDTVEIDATFYGLPPQKVFEAWRARAPRGFLHALKFSGYGTHRKRLREPEATVPRFFEAARYLGPTLGPVLVQLPPRWRADPERLDAFLACWPRGVRCAVELRDASWLCRPVFTVLRQHRAALCLHDLLPRHPREVTAGFVYLRFHGPGGGGEGRYPSQRLVAEARRIRGWLEEGTDVHAYFNNDAGGAAVSDALALLRYVGPVAHF